MAKLYVVGIGPGRADLMTREALEALNEAEVIAGYRLYVELIRGQFPDKTYIETGMRGETERCRRAVEEAAAGRVTAVISSGDAGVYGMAGLVLELAENVPDAEVIVIPGITAALSGGAVLGAPLGHDFAVISLSDLLTPWETIENRLRAAAAGGFCLALYNPASRHRQDYLAKAAGILLEILPPETVCGYVRQIGRDGETSGLLTLGELPSFGADMLTTVFVGSRSTRVINGRMVTPRGYSV